MIAPALHWKLVSILLLSHIWGKKKLLETAAPSPIPPSISPFSLSLPVSQCFSAHSSPYRRLCHPLCFQCSEYSGWGWLCFPVAAIFLHNTTNVLWGHINMNASWCGTHRRTGGTGGGGATSSPPPVLFPSSSTREMAFVPAHGVVHHSGTKRLNQVVWSNSPWGFNATETRDYRLAVAVLQRTPLWHSTMQKPFSDTFPQCKTGAAPWDFRDGGKKIQKSIRRALHACTPHWLYIEKCCIHEKNGAGKITFWGERISSSTGVLSRMWLSGIQNWCQSVFIQPSVDLQVLLPRRP